MIPHSAALTDAGYVGSLTSNFVGYSFSYEHSNAPEATVPPSASGPPPQTSSSPPSAERNAEQPAKPSLTVPSDRARSTSEVAMQGAAGVCAGAVPGDRLVSFVAWWRENMLPDHDSSPNYMNMERSKRCGD